MTLAIERADPAAAARLPGLDLLRGLAIVAMVAYHFSWDLTLVRLADLPLFTHPFWLAARTLILSGFLLLVGVGQALANRGGQPPARAAWRLAKIAGAATLISGASLVAFPESWIFFGVLHLIAVASLACLMLARLPRLGLLALAGLCLVLPDVVASPAFAQPWLLWTGLAPWPPVSNDYVPVFPWLGIVLIGLAWPEPAVALARRLSFDGPAAAMLAWAGRHSLAVYLVHQPILLAILAAVTVVFGIGVPLF